MAKEIALGVFQVHFAAAGYFAIDFAACDGLDVANGHELVGPAAVIVGRKVGDAYDTATADFIVSGTAEAAADTHSDAPHPDLKTFVRFKKKKGEPGKQLGSERYAIRAECIDSFGDLQVRSADLIVDDKPRVTGE